MQLNELISIDKDTLGGIPVFVGTRVPVGSLFEHLENGYTLDQFIEQFPSVKKEQAQQVLELANQALLSGNYGQVA
ncbi:MAG: DUF433 domain-containing protein [Flavobacteriales bacterium]|nr:DUF433 domain-containing protein [Flavobacteriales bacterium]